MFKSKYLAYTEYTDEALMRLIADKNQAALEELYGRYGSRMYRYFLKALQFQTEKAADFTQDLFLKIIEQPRAFDPDRSFKTWIFTIAANMCRNEFRNTSNRSRAVWIMEDQWTEDHAPGIDSPVLGQYLEVALSKLDEGHRQCFLLRYQEEMSVKEISEMMQCPEGTVKSRLFYALRRLASILKMVKKDIYLL
jgi:RNA polymerase sigma-70 factor (ECF subfamily)